MTLQRVMEIMVGKDREELSNTFLNTLNRPQQQQQQQSRRPKTNPDVAPVFRGEVVRPEVAGPNDLPDFRQPRTGARHMKNESPKNRFKQLDFKVSDAEITTLRTTPLTTSKNVARPNANVGGQNVKFPVDSGLTTGNRNSLISGGRNPGNGAVAIVTGRPIDPLEEEKMKKRRLEIENLQRQKELEKNKNKNQFLGGDNFDHSVNTLATLANPDLDFFPTTESSDKLFTDSFITRDQYYKTDFAVTQLCGYILMHYLYLQLSVINLTFS